MILAVAALLLHVPAVPQNVIAPATGIASRVSGVSPDTGSAPSYEDAPPAIVSHI
jgi:hypothetical protein